MSDDTNNDDVKYVENWDDEATQCKNCACYQEHKDKHVCVPTDGSKTFEEALEEYGEVCPCGHCKCFEAKE